MLAKKTVKNQAALPKFATNRFPGIKYFDVRTKAEHIILEPSKAGRTSRLSAKLARLNFLKRTSPKP